MSDSLQTVAIVGGGIGGLTSALALAHVGIHSIVFERYRGSDDVGAGIQLSPNATRVLFQLDLAKELSALGRTSETMDWLDGETDKLIAQFPMRTYINETFDTPYLQLYRPDLIRVLQSKCINEPRIEFRQGVSVEKLNFDADGIMLTTSAGNVHADLCIGADGTNSTIRTYVNYAFTKHIFAGFAYRATIPLSRIDEYFSLKTTNLWLNSSYHVVTYIVGRDPVLNCVFVVESEDPGISNDMHRQRSTRSALKEAISTPSPLLKVLLDQVPEETIYKWPIYQFPPVAVLGSAEHPLALIGDAWHTTLPFAGQGAALAIEDAFALADCLSGERSSSLANRLIRFEAARIPRVQQVQIISARNRIVYHLKNPILKILRSWIALPAYLRTTKQLFGYLESSLTN